MKRDAVLSIVMLFLTVNVAAQSRKKYDHFYIELNKGGKAVALTFHEGEGVSCSGIIVANGTILSVDWDIVVTKFTANLKTRKMSFFIPDSLNEISNVDRGDLSEIFRKGSRMRIAWRECGSGNVPNLIGVKVIR